MLIWDFQKGPSISHWTTGIISVAINAHSSRTDGRIKVLASFHSQVSLWITKLRGLIGILSGWQQWVLFGPRQYTVRTVLLAELSLFTSAIISHYTLVSRYSSTAAQRRGDIRVRCLSQLHWPWDTAVGLHPTLWTVDQTSSITRRYVPGFYTGIIWYCLVTVGVNNLPRVVTQPRRDRESNPRPLGYKSDAFPLRNNHTAFCTFFQWQNLEKDMNWPTHAVLGYNTIQYNIRLLEAVRTQRRTIIEREKYVENENVKMVHNE